MGLAGTAGLPKGRCLTRCQVTPVGVRWLREALLPTMSHIAWYQSRIEDRVVVTVATLGVSACHPSPTIRVSTVCQEAGKEAIGIGFEPAKALVRGLPATATPTAVLPGSFRRPTSLTTYQGSLAGYPTGQIPNIGGVHGTEGVGTTSDRMVAGGGEHEWGLMLLSSLHVPTSNFNYLERGEFISTVTSGLRDFKGSIAFGSMTLDDTRIVFQAHP